MPDFLEAKVGHFQQVTSYPLPAHESGTKGPKIDVLGCGNDSR